MNNFSDIISTNINEFIKIKIENFFQTFTNNITKELDISNEVILNIWNKSVPEFNFNKFENNNYVDKIINEDTCSFILRKGKNKDKRCINKVCKKSKVGYCSLHYKVENPDNKDEKDEKECCVFIFKKGKKKDQRCTNKKSKKSLLGYCSLHKKSEIEYKNDNSDVSDSEDENLKKIKKTKNNSDSDSEDEKPKKSSKFFNYDD